MFCLLGILCLLVHSYILIAEKLVWTLFIVIITYNLNRQDGTIGKVSQSVIFPDCLKLNLHLNAFLSACIVNLRQLCLGGNVCPVSLYLSHHGLKSRDVQRKMHFSLWPHSVKFLKYLIFQEAEESSILLLLPKCPASSSVCTLWESQMYAEDWRLCYTSSRCLYNRVWHGGKIYA